MTSVRNLPVDALVELALTDDRRAVGRLLTLVERNGPEATECAMMLHAHGTGSHVIGITGAPGAGKSTLVGEMVQQMVDGGSHPAVLAVDPSSPLTGGAILGDRVRMAGVTEAFIRSVATRGHAGGLALAIPGAVRVFDAVGYNPVVIETVGVGQVEVDVTAAADTTVVVVTPGMGDAVQANKAGLLEVADIFVVNKADRPGASDARRDLELMLDLSHMTGQEDASYRPPILMTNSLEGEGHSAVIDAIETHRRHLVDTGQLAKRRRRRIEFEIESRLSTVFEQRMIELKTDQRWVDIVDTTTAGTIAPPAASQQVANLLLH
ncbi:MAG: methylmalonyl Co-A mutase-associated GTPase MeaB [Actinomycetia bacterium]|nr:methylmalonyl Co-A mutase-associated GTPase MeaB [Actinomycetes bacterium]